MMLTGKIENMSMACMCDPSLSLSVSLWWNGLRIICGDMEAGDGVVKGAIVVV